MVARDDEDDRPDKTVHEPHAEMLAAIRSEAAVTREIDGASPLPVPEQLVQPTNTTPDPPTSLGLRFKQPDVTMKKSAIGREGYSSVEILMIAGSIVVAAGIVIAVYFLR